MTEIEFLKPLACYSLSAKAGDPAALREKASMNFEVQKANLKLWSNGFSGQDGLFFVSTCHRVELYVWSLDHEKIYKQWVQYAESRGALKKDFIDSTEMYFGTTALEHMYRVCSGLESEVLGETQVLGQFKDSVAEAKKNKLLKGPLEKSTQLAFQTAKKVRNETAIGEGTVSIAHAAIDGLSDVFEGLAGKNALIVGAGTMALQSVEKLCSNGLEKIYWANRNLDKIESHALYKKNSEQIEIVGLSDVPKYMFKANFSIFATSAQAPLVNLESLKSYVSSTAEKTEDRGLQVILDMGLPRNVDQKLHKFKNFVLRDVDEFSDKSLKGHAQREKALPKAEKIIEEQLILSTTHWNSYKKSPLLKDFFSSIKEFEKLTQDAIQVELDVDKSSKIEYIIHSFYGKLSHGLLREIQSIEDDETSAQMLELFTRACRRAKMEATKD